MYAATLEGSMTDHDPRLELAEVEDQLRRLTARRDELRSLVVGPRVEPVVVVWSHGQRSEDDFFDDLKDAARFARFDHDNLYVECVKVGGYVLTEDEVDALVEGSPRG